MLPPGLATQLLPRKRYIMAVTLGYEACYAAQHLLLHRCERVSMLIAISLLETALLRCRHVVRGHVVHLPFLSLCA